MIDSTPSNKGVILVTGCSGRIGKLVAQRFGALGYTVVGFDIAQPSHPAATFIDFYKVDLSDDASVEENLKRVEQKHGSHLVSVIHLAAYYSFAGERPELYDKITVQGTARLLRGVKKFAKVEQFLFSSTQLIYAPTEVGEVIDEDSKIASTWDYPLSKIKTEKILLSESGTIPVVLLRIAGCYDDECHSIPISNQIQRIFERQLESRLFPGNLAHGAPFLHLDDLVDAIVLSVEKRLKLPKEAIFLIGEPTTHSYEQMQRALWRLITGRERLTLRIPKWFAKMGAWIQNQIPGFQTFIKPWMIDVADCHYQLNVDRAKKLLGWAPKREVMQTLPLMIDALKKDPIAWYKLNGLAMPKSLEKRYNKKV